MERMLGRYLLQGENVHHRNGVPSDNRPSNLELWVKPQPNGCRVEDAIAWAREILARYENGPPGGGGPFLKWWRRRVVETRVQSGSTSDLLQAYSVIWISRFGPPPTGFLCASRVILSGPYPAFGPQHPD